MRDLDQALAPVPVWVHLRLFLGLLFGLRKHDFRAAQTWINPMYPGVSAVERVEGSGLPAISGLMQIRNAKE